MPNTTKNLKTRIKNKIDVITEWQKNKLTLLDGEIALVRVPTGQTYTNPVTGEDEPIVELLLKVGDGTTTDFNALPWLSAKASDVYAWAKNPDAESLNLSIVTGKDTAGEDVITEKSLATWLSEIRTKANTADTTATGAADAVNKLNGNANTAGSVANSIATAIKALSHNNPKGTGNFVKAVEQANGKITVTYGNLTASDIPTISSDKITVGSSTTTGTLSKKLQDIDTAVAGKLAGVASSTTDSSTTKASFVTSISKDANNNVTHKKRNLIVADLPTGIPAANLASNAVTTVKINSKAVTTDKINDEAVTNAKVAAGVKAEKIEVTAAVGTAGDSGYKAPVMLDDALNEINNKFILINDEIKGGVHFVGISSTAITDESTTGNLTIEGESSKYTPTANNAGDVVIYNKKEFIWTGSKWKELGDLTRVGTVENLLSSISEAAKTSKKFVTHIATENGKLVTKKAQPAATDVSYNTNSTVAVALDSVIQDEVPKLASIAKGSNVSAFVDGKLNDFLGTTDPTAGTNATTDTGFVTSIKRSTVNGKVVASVERKTLPVASASKAGIVQLNATNGALSYKTYSDFLTNDFTPATQRIDVIEDNYIKVSNQKMYLGDDTQEIVFDCGGAE